MHWKHLKEDRKGLFLADAILKVGYFKLWLTLNILQFTMGMLAIMNRAKFHFTVARR